MHPNDKGKDQRWIHGCSFPLEGGGFSVANQSAGSHWEQQTWVMFAVLRSCRIACLLFMPTLQLPPFLHILYSGETSWDRRAWAVPCSVKSSSQYPVTETFSGVAAGAKTPDAECYAARRKACHLPERFFLPLISQHQCLKAPFFLWEQLHCKRQ